MSQPVSESEARGRRPRWFGFVQLVLILAAIAAALYFARAPERVVRGVASDLSPTRGRVPPSAWSGRCRSSRP